ncbi:MAG: acyltransferase family protein [Xanthobacteraceae bacterium]|nr:acyltransferase family protein [Xanthobacteraceae bacterium]
MSAMATYEKPRVDWVDYAKGFCIIMVVMMHSTLGVEHAAGKESWMGYFVAFAKPFRMPDFFLISGLFLARVIDRNWRDYLDKKAVHFLYFYVLWVTIQFVFKAPGFLAQGGLTNVAAQYALAFVEPFGTLWFIYILPFFFVLTKLTKRIPPLAIFAAAAALEIAPIHTGWIVIDEFAARFVYFFAGYWLAQHFFSFASGVQKDPWLALAGLGGWAIVNDLLVVKGYSDLPFVSLALGFAGAAAIVALAALLAKVNWFSLLRYAGENSIVVYLAFFLPMAATRAALLKTGAIPDLGTVALIVTAMGVIVPLLFHAIVRGTRLDFLFVRPTAFQIGGKRKAPLQPAE